ncbi:MAG: gamma-glutamyl-gamma-aminobutyrate hydrolase family protein [Desulfuromonadaceae bacterium]|nr:gamma-glutamyl-gamma-aminobutyrate hydrolase family protein [Desulfuromonadaceae bacterium]
MRAHYLQHVAFEGLGQIEPWLKNHGYHISRTAFFQQQGLPDLAGIDLLIVMGGPMSVNDETIFPWLAREKAFVRQALQQGVPMLGICLGAQLMASALGARVFPNGQREIGWFPVQGLPVGQGAFAFPPSQEVFHWHGETFELPTGAQHLARSAACEHQAFQVGAHAIGLQFHLETSPEAAQSLVQHCREELTPAPYVQSEEQLLDLTSCYWGAANGLLDQLLCFLTGC